MLEAYRGSVMRGRALRDALPQRGLGPHAKTAAACATAVLSVVLARPQAKGGYLLAFLASASLTSSSCTEFGTGA